MHIGILGPIQVTDRSREITPNAAKLRQMLALLALNAGRTVTVNDVLEELWDDAAPRSARTTVHTYVLQLRRKLRAAAVHHGNVTDVKDVLQTCHGGYRLQLEPGQLDTLEFDHQARIGTRSFEAGDYQRAARELQQALQVWRGPALSGMDCGPLLRAEIVKLEAQRFVVLENRLHADLHCGRHQQILAELTGLVERYPMQENFYEMLMLAMYRSGQRLHALQLFRSLRQRLSDEVGLEPNVPTQRLHQAILIDAPELELAESGAAR